MPEYSENDFFVEIDDSVLLKKKTFAGVEGEKQTKEGNTTHSNILQGENETIRSEQTESGIEHDQYIRTFIKCCESIVTGVRSKIEKALSGYCYDKESSFHCDGVSDACQQMNEQFGVIDAMMQRVLVAYSDMKHPDKNFLQSFIYQLAIYFQKIEKSLDSDSNDALSLYDYGQFTIAIEEEYKALIYFYATHENNFHFVKSHLKTVTLSPQFDEYLELFESIILVYQLQASLIKKFAAESNAHIVFDESVTPKKQLKLIEQVNDLVNTAFKSLREWSQIFDNVPPDHKMYAVILKLRSEVHLGANLLQYLTRYTFSDEANFYLYQQDMNRCLTTIQNNLELIVCEVQERENGHIPRVDCCNMSDFLQKVVDDLPFKISLENQSVPEREGVLILNSNLIEKAPDYVVQFYDQVLYDALSNMITNAIKAGASKMLLYVRDDFEDSSAFQVIISDNGAPFPDHIVKALQNNTEYESDWADSNMGTGTGLGNFQNALQSLGGELCIHQSHGMKVMSFCLKKADLENIEKQQNVSAAETQATKITTRVLNKEIL